MSPIHIGKLANFRFRFKQYTNTDEHLRESTDEYIYLDKK